ncbi:cytosolic arginine sensor for mTORC1 subunit 1 isoform X3 [Lemur catta]|uniref:cytosolic arginine sensor for mTORC1 subunit 1 isoform X3 n=1 Tax=Lemur catta TaxID=9447 RepID=UPI001E26E7E0|nr:cytosolic arginine sensor for mTORC1 subunit 1 isoform X3 [Lemur catta]
MIPATAFPEPSMSPQNRFCVLTLDPETLPAIATTLIDVLFYSHRWALFAFCLCPHTTVCYAVSHCLPVRALSCVSGFLTAHHAQLPFTDLRGRPRPQSWSSLLRYWQSHPGAVPWSHPLLRGPLSLAQAGFIVLPPSCPHLPEGWALAQGSSDKRVCLGLLCQPLPRGLEAEWEEVEWAGWLAEPLNLPCLPSAPKEAASVSPEPSCIPFFAFSLIEGYISIVMDAETQKKFPSDLLLTSSSGELWRMVRIGGQPLGFDECGIVAQIAGPLAAADISAYYISTFNFDHALVPEDGIGSVIEVLQRRQEGLDS